MRTESRRTVPTNLAVLVSTALLACLFASAPSAWAQTGENAVFNSAGSTVASASFFDATQFSVVSTDICLKINTTLTGRAGTIVVDARGVSTPSTCNMDPFLGISKGSVVLLPAGTITINNTWSPQNQTRIIGIGVPGTGGVGTTLVAGAISPGGTMIQFPGASCNSPGFGVSVEDLGMSGANGVSAIVNNFSQEQSYVKHVNFISFTAPVLIIGNTPGTCGAANSGPYENLYIRQVSNSCVILNSSQTRGIHGMTCTGGTSLPQAGVKLDGSNNMIEDVHFEGFQDGILIGSQTGGSQAFGDVISAVNGLTTTKNGPMNNVIHISNANVVQDLVLTGIQAGANLGQGAAPNSIKDDETSTTLSDSTVAVYALGESPQAGEGYTRFTSSSSQPSWYVGSSAATGGPCTVGSLYSNRGATTPNTTMYICVPTMSGSVWTALAIP